VLILDFVRGEVVDETTNPEAAQRLRDETSRQLREMTVGAGGVPADQAVS
jgi:hypothetical protein